MVIEGYWYTNIGSRSENEDSCAYFSPGPDQYCAVICDGLGGHGGGKTASSIGVKALSQWQADEALPSGETILAWMNEANRNILATRANANQMKTTAVALYLYKNQAVWAHIGDSRLYHFHNGVLADYTEDHSLAQLSIKMGELHSRSEIPSFEGRSKLFRVIGDDEIKPQLHAPITLSPGDHAFLLCSDGLWERLLEDEIMLDLALGKTTALPPPGEAGDTDVLAGERTMISPTEWVQQFDDVRYEADLVAITSRLEHRLGGRAETVATVPPDFGRLLDSGVSGKVLPHMPLPGTPAFGVLPSEKK